MQGHEPFLELNSLNDNDKSTIIARYTPGRFPPELSFRREYCLRVLVGDEEITGRNSDICAA
jgi:hypothetical protein